MSASSAQSPALANQLFALFPSTVFLVPPVFRLVEALRAEGLFDFRGKCCQPAGVRTYLSLSIYIYIYIYVCTVVIISCVIYIYIYIHIQIVRDIETSMTKDAEGFARCATIRSATVPASLPSKRAGRDSG